MTEPTGAARQRCADLSQQEKRNRNAHTTMECDQLAFARHVQSTSDAMREIVRICHDTPLDAIDRIEALARTMILPEPKVDPLILEARRIVETTIHWSPQTDRDLQSGKNDQSAEMKIAVAALERGYDLAKSGKKIMIVEAE